MAAILDGRTYICISCHRKLFKDGVKALGENWEQVLEKKFPSYIKNYIGKMKIPIFRTCIENQTN